MRLTNWGDPEEGMNVPALWAEIGKYEWVTVVMPSGHRVDVFADKVLVSDPTTPRTVDGKAVWTL